MTKFTRRELYDLIWSMPVSKLAESFGLSDRGLAKICERHRVPVPPRGYWAKKEAGKRVKQAIFAETEDPLLDRVEIPSTRDLLPEPVREIVERRRAERKTASTVARADTMHPPESPPIRNPHPSVKATAEALRRAKPSALGVVQAAGPGLCGISIAESSVERMISILDCLARACEARAMTFVPADNRMQAEIGPDSASFEIQEKTKQVPHVLTEPEIVAEEKRRRRNERWSRGNVDWGDIGFSPGPPKFDTVLTGELGLEISGWGRGLRRSWRDGKTQVLETLIDEIVDGLEAHIVSARVWREKRERDEAERAELDRRRALSKARAERERSRNALLMKLIVAERRAKQLREWIGVKEMELARCTDPDLRRMTIWASDQLASLTDMLDPANVAAEIKKGALFPELDELDDPLGEPPKAELW